MPTLYEQEIEAARRVDLENMSYEQLQDLCDKIGTVKKGISKETYARIPTRVLTKHSSTSSCTNSGGSAASITKNNIAAAAAAAKTGAEHPSSSQHKPKQQQHQLHKEACCICMTELLDPESKTSKIKQLPCKHTFHAQCIKQWLSSHTSCPVCKADIAKQAASVGSLLCQLM